MGYGGLAFFVSRAGPANKIYIHLFKVKIASNIIGIITSS